MLINVSEKAKDKLKEILSEEDTDKSLRLYIAGYGWAGPSFGMALDEPKDQDLKIEAGGFKFLVEEDLGHLYNNLSVDYNDRWLKKGFIIGPEGKSSC